MHQEEVHRDRCLRDPDFRKSMLEHDRDEDVCIKWDALAEQGFLSLHDGIRIFSIQNWWISLIKSGDTGPLKDRSDFNDALTTLNRLHQESGEQQLRPVPCWKYQRWHQSSSSSSSWWQWSDSWWSS